MTGMLYKYSSPNLSLVGFLRDGARVVTVGQG